MRQNTTRRNKRHERAVVVFLCFKEIELNSPSATEHTYLLCTRISYRWRFTKTGDFYFWGNTHLAGEQTTYYLPVALLRVVLGTYTGAVNVGAWTAG